MATAEDIRKEVKAIIRGAWSVREGKKIPDVEDLKLSNDGVTFEAVVMYADLADSTALVTGYKPEFAAEIYKSYLISACRIITNNSGEITAFDGDRVMAVFFEGNKNTNAAKTALQINWAAGMVNEELKSFYTQSSYTVKQAVGIDAGKLLVAKTGVRGSNDLVWVGGAANYAAKLCSLRKDYYASWMTDTVYGYVLDEAKYRLSDRQPMWEQKYSPEFGKTVYASSWSWTP